MPKVWCATLECKHNRGNQCRAKSINLSDGHIHTVHQGFKHIHECCTYENSEQWETLKRLMEGCFSVKGGNDGN